MANLPAGCQTPAAACEATPATSTDGLEVTVASAARFTPSDTAAGTHPGQVGVLVTVTITNGGSDSVDLTSTQVQLTTGTAGNVADAIFDTDNGLGSGFQGSVLPGHSETAKFGFSVAPSDLSDVVIQVTPGFNYDPSSFEGSVS